VNANASQHEHSILGLDITLSLGGELAPLGPDPARLQRTRKGSKQSTACGGDNVVERGGVWFDDVAAKPVVRSDRAMCAKAHRVRFSGQIRQPERTGDALDSDARDVYGLGHRRNGRASESTRAVPQ
jgi:hypothetical protein